MKFVIFCHSIVSCWNHGNAHFLRGIARELIGRGHEVTVHEPALGWSRTNLIADQGEAPLAEATRLVPGLNVALYDLPSLDLDEALDGAAVVIVHEWTDPDLVRRIGRRRAAGGSFTLFFHDTHHRTITAPDEIGRFDLSGYDAVLAFGEMLRQVYEARGWGQRAFAWHEAADWPLFHPLESNEKDIDLVWIGNWGDDERDRELAEYLVEPSVRLDLKTRIHGVRYPDEVCARLHRLGIDFAGWLANHRVPHVFSRARATVHVPRRAYVEALPGIPTIRMFEALACGIPLASAPWDDAEGLFPSDSYICVRSGNEMCSALALLMNDEGMRTDLARKGVEAIRSRHTCAHRVDELFATIAKLGDRCAARPDRYEVAAA